MLTADFLEIDLLAWLRTVIRAWKLLVGIIILALLVAGVYTLLQPRLYKATAVLMITQTSLQTSPDPQLADSRKSMSGQRLDRPARTLSGTPTGGAAARAQVLSALVRSPFARNAGSLYLIQFANYLLPLISVPYLVRVLEPAGYGAAAFAQGFINYLMLFVEYGFDWSATRKISVQRDDPKAVSATALQVWGAKGLLSLAGFGVLLVATAVVPKLAEVSWLLFAFYGLVIGNVLFPTWLFQGMESMVAISVINLGMRAAVLVGMFALVRRPEDVVIYAVLTGGGGVAAGAVGAAVAWRMFGLKPMRISWAGVWGALKEGWVLFLSKASVSLYTVGNAFILGLLTGPVAVGYYSAAERIVKGSLSLVSPLAQAVYPRFNKLAAESKELALFWGQRMLLVMGGIGLVLSLVILVGANIIVSVLLGLQYGPSIGVMQIMALVPLLVSISNVLGVQLMLSFGLDKAFTAILFGAGFLNVITAIFLAPGLGAVGMAVAVLISEAFVTVAMLAYLHRQGLGPVSSWGLQPWPRKEL